MTNRQRLENAGIVESTATWTPEQTDAVEDLTEEEIDALISVKTKLGNLFPLTGQPVAPVKRFS